MKPKVYVAIDLKSFYASVECFERGLDPMTTHLVVADANRTEKTICLAVSPSLKKLGLPGRCRLFEVIQKIKKINYDRVRNAPRRMFTGKSYDAIELQQDPSLEITYITATPRMALYMEYSTKIYSIYLKYMAPEDIHVYSIDEVFIDLTSYLNTYKLTPKQLVSKIILDIIETTGITATAGIGSNLYLCKVAMDIMAKHAPADENGVRIAELDEMRYRKLLWDHQPITDFWRVGRGYAKKLADHGMYTMGDVARCSVSEDIVLNEALLYKLFGINAELLIDHAWGYEPCTMEYIKSYKPSNNSLGSGQVLLYPYTNEKARLVLQEMCEQLALDLVDKGLVTDQIVLTVGYDIENLLDPDIEYTGETVEDHYGRWVPKHAHGSANLKQHTASTKWINEATLKLYDKIVNKSLLVRRLNIAANHVITEEKAKSIPMYEQLDLFTDYEALQVQDEKEAKELQREKDLQKSILLLKKKYGKNSVLKAMDLEEGATAKDRNAQIGGHKA
ncbi:MAG: DNA methylase [Erysipelotrichales bacterium]|nr:DNA methylase [Erysipelotrichales bacterium]